MTQKKKEPSGSAKVGRYDTRSTDLSGRGADQVKPHTELAEEKPAPKPDPEAAGTSGEVAGAMRDQVGKGRAGH